MNNEEKILAMLEQLQQGQAVTNARLDTMQEDIDQIKEDTSITLEAVNGLGEWAEIVADVLRVEYPIKK